MTIYWFHKCNQVTEKDANQIKDIVSTTCEESSTQLNTDDFFHFLSADKGIFMTFFME